MPVLLVRQEFLDVSGKDRRFDNEHTNNIRQWRSTRKRNLCERKEPFRLGTSVPKWGKVKGDQTGRPLPVAPSPLTLRRLPADLPISPNSPAFRSHPSESQGEMGISQRYLRRLVAKNLPYRPKVNSGHDHVAGRCVPQSMKGEMPIDLGILPSSSCSTRTRQKRSERPRRASPTS